MKKENTLLLHIGMPKTGTTSLQNFLISNSDIIKEFGWCYPDLVKDWFFINGEEIVRRDRNGLLLRLCIAEEWNGKKEKKLWDIILNYLRYYNVILSDEGIAAVPGIDIEKGLKNFKSHYNNIKVIVYIRRQDLYIESLWNHKVKVELNGDKLDDFLKLNPEKAVYPDYLTLIRDIERILGRDNLIIRVYEKGQFEGDRADIISDFVSSLDRINGTEMKEYKKWNYPENSNLRLDCDKFWMKLLFNREYKQYTQEGDPIVKDVFIKKNNKDTKTYGYFSEDERNKILAKYQEDNKVIAKEYLHREDGRVFYDTNTNIPMYIPDLSEREIDLIKMMAMITYEKEKVIRRIGAEQTGVKNSISNSLRRTINKADAALRRLSYPIRIKKLQRKIEDQQIRVRRN